MSEEANGDGTVDWSYYTAQLFDTCPRAVFFHQQTQSTDPGRDVETESELPINHVEVAGRSRGGYHASEYQSAD
jgi:hypothetical protein